MDWNANGFTRTVKLSFETASASPESKFTVSLVSEAASGLREGSEGDSLVVLRR
jgi:hypothetical protein